MERVGGDGFAAMTIIHSPDCLGYEAFGHVESPRRVADTAELLRRSHHEWLTPTPADLADIERVHTPAMMDAVQTGDYFDADTPHFDNIFDLARLSAGAAVLAAKRALAGQPAFSLMRPPGHHATRECVMGFCYFNCLAIAVAKFASANRRVAIVDFDCHHGNGTEDIVAGRQDVLFVSLHQSPCYPGTGTSSHGNCRNYPLPPGTGPAAYMAAFDRALDEVRAFHPDLLAVSAGFDAYRGDPITSMALEIETFAQIGARLAALDLPRFAILEGGYAAELPKCIESFIASFS